MKLRNMSLTILLLLIFCAETTNAAGFQWATVWSENRYYADTGIQEYYMISSVTADTPDYRVYVQNIPGAAGGVELQYTPGWDDFMPYQFSTGFKSTQGYPAPGAVWEHSYTFYMDLNGNGLYDAGEPTQSSSIPANSIHQMDFAHNVIVYGDYTPVVKWNSAADAEFYRVRVFTVVDGHPSTEDLLYTSANIEENGSGAYAHAITGSLFAQNQTLAIAVEAYDVIDGFGLVNRSRYFVLHSAADVQTACDVNGDEKLGLEEAVFVLQIVAGIQQNPSDQIAAGYAAAIAALNSKDLTTLMSHFSLNYLYDGETYTDMQNQFSAMFSDPGFAPVTYTLADIETTGNTATAVVTHEGEGPSIEFFLNENGMWKLYGNQHPYPIETYSYHLAEGYFANIMVEDINHSISSASVTGPGISGSISLQYSPFGGQFWEVGSNDSVFLGTSAPPSNPPFTVTITDGSGTHAYTENISGYVADFASNLLPSGTVGGTVTISWTGIAGADYYSVALNDASGNRLWEKSPLTGSTSVVYDGPSLTPGATYTFSVGSHIIAFGNANGSFVEGTFTYAQ